MRKLGRAQDPLVSMVNGSVAKAMTNGSVAGPNSDRSYDKI